MSSTLLLALRWRWQAFAGVALIDNDPQKAISLCIGRNKIKAYQHTINHNYIIDKAMKNLAVAAITTFYVAVAAASDGNVLSPAGSKVTPINAIATNYTDDDGTTLQGFLSLPTSVSNNTTKLPAVIVLHDSDGPNKYEQQRASILASDEFGFVAFAADMFGYDAELPPPGTWGVGPVADLNANVTLFVMRIQAAIDYVQDLDYVDETKVALVGYCLGGTGIVHYLNTNGNQESTEGAAPPVAGANGVHPSILGDWGSPKGEIAIPALFLTGGDDFLTGPEAMKKLEKDMSNSVSPWETVRYSQIGHAFSNWWSEDSYNPRVDARSWRFTTNFLREVFGTNNLQHRLPSLPADVDIEPVDYAKDEDFGPLKGFVAMPPNSKSMEEEGILMPVVIRLLDGKGEDDMNDQLLAKENAMSGYIWFIAYTQADVLIPSNNTDTFLSCVKAAIAYAKTNIQGADPNNIAIGGYVGMGITRTSSDYSGTGAIYFAMSDDVDEGVKAILIGKGNLEEVAKSQMVADALLMSDVANGSGGWGNNGGGGEGFDWSSDAANQDWNGNIDADNSIWSGAVGDVNDSGQWPQDEDAPSSSSPWGNERRMNEITTNNKPQILLLSDVNTDDMDDVIKVENAFIALDLNYELTRVASEGESSATAFVRDQAKTLLTEVFAPYEYEQSSTSSETIPDTNSSETKPDTITDNSSAASKLEAFSFAGLLLVMYIGGNQLL